MEYLLGAFGIVWLSLFWYIYHISRKQKELESDIEQLRMRLESSNQSETH